MSAPSLSLPHHWACMLSLLLLFGVRPASAITATVINGTSNQSLTVTYDSNSVPVGTAVNVHVVGSVSGNTYEFGGNYNRSWEGGDANFTLDPNGIWGYSMGGQTSIDRWMTITPGEAGTFKVGIMLSSFPSYEQAHAYIDFTAYTLSSAITSATAVSRNQGQDAGYTITATNSPTSFGATGLPDAAAVNTATGAITGRLNDTGTISSSITASNSAGGDTKTLTWTITAASINPAATITPNVVTLGSSVTLTRAGTTNFGLAWTESTIWRPTSGSQSLGNAGLGSQSYTPADGTGVYSYQFRMVDIYSNYADQWITFTVALAPPATFQADTVLSNQVDLSWAAVSGAAGYNIYRNGVKINATLITGTTYSDTGILPGASYAYVVHSVTAGGIESVDSATVNVTTAGAFEVFTPLSN